MNSESRTEALRRELYEGVVKGMVEIVGEREGESVFSLTEHGKAHMERLLDRYITEHGTDAAQALAAHLEVPLWMAEELISYRLGELADG
jgi:hypothetical protein